MFVHPPELLYLAAVFCMEHSAPAASLWPYVAFMSVLQGRSRCTVLAPCSSVGVDTSTGVTGCSTPADSWANGAICCCITGRCLVLSALTISVDGATSVGLPLLLLCLCECLCVRVCVRVCLMYHLHFPTGASAVAAIHCKGPISAIHALLAL